jgi:acyl-coenzyme A synthetase/AMP-(fatty) acid ligase
MDQLHAPRVYAGGRWWTSRFVAGMASSWQGALARLSPSERTPIAAVLPPSAAGVALFMALASRRATLVLLSPNPSTWPAARREFQAMPLVLPPESAALAGPARRLGFTPVLLDIDAPDDAGDVPAALPLRAPDVVLFTSGSTGEAKAVVRTLTSKITGAVTRARALGLSPGEGCLIGVPLTSGQGVTMMLTAMHLQGALGLLSPVDHRGALAALALPDFAFWWATPHFADVLGRVALTRTPTVPRLCVTSSPISRDVFDRFVRRYGVPLRQLYSSTETGPVSADTSPADAVRHGCVGRPLPGVALRIGDRPDQPVTLGQVGQIWIRSPHLMSGYGVPPYVEPLEHVDGWWATRDLGRLDDLGRLWLEGRLDYCVRSRDGRLVNLAAVEARLRDLPGVRAVAVVKTMSTGGATFAAVVELADGETAPARLPLADLPDWARPRRIVTVPLLPMLPNGKVDRRGCAALLEGAILA